MTDHLKSDLVVNRFERKPNGYTDEEGTFAYVDVTATTDTAEKARDWLVENASEVLYIREGESRVVRANIELRDIGVTLSRPEPLLPSAWAVEHLIREGHAEAWWSFDVSTASEPVAGYEDRLDRQMVEQREKCKRQSVEWRGPWWWRLRCRVADAITAFGTRLDPADRSSTSWFEAGEIHIAPIRRPSDG
jgi:hypothetical protein